MSTQKPPHGAKLWPLLESMELISIAEQDPGALAQPIDLYIWFRSNIILARYESVEAELKKRDAIFEDSRIPLLLHSQIKCFYGRDPEETLNALIKQSEEAQGDPYLRAETEFTLGLLHAQLCRFRKSLVHYERSVALYRELGLFRQQAVAHFNLSVNANHLQFKSLFETHQAEFQRITEETRDPALRAYRHRLAGYRALDIEDFKHAREDFAQARELYARFGRKRDSENAATFLAYLHLKEQRVLQFQELCDQHLSPLGADPLDVNRARLSWFRKVSEIGFLSVSQAERLVKDLKRQQVDGITFIFVLDLIFERLLSGRDYEGVLALYKRVSAIPRLLEQSIELVDLRHYPIEANFALGLRIEGSYLLAQYENDSKGTKSEARLKRIAEFREKYLCGTILPETSSPDKPEHSCLLDKTRHQLVVNGKKIDLSKKESLMRLFIVLFENPHGILYEQAFKRCYAQAFNPLLHQARFNSLIARAKRCLGIPQAILWRDQTLQIHPSILAQIVFSPGLMPEQQMRLEKLEEIVKTLGADVSISQIEARYPFSRRTLQADLKALVEAEKLVRRGQGRSTVYGKAG